MMAAIATGAVALVAAIPAFAQVQEATPGATPMAQSCTVDPRPTSFLADLLNAPEPEVVPTAVTDVPRGVAVDEQTRVQVLAVLDQLIVCVNAGEYLRSFSLFDDEYLRRVIDPDGLMTEGVALELGKTLATPEPAADEAVTELVEVISVEQLEDGSVVVVFRSRVGGEDGAEQTDLFVFRQIGDSWKIVDGKTNVVIE